MYYSQQTGGFYDEAIHGTRKIFATSQDNDGVFSHTEVDNHDCKIPSDAVEITQEEYDALFEAQAQGKVISWDDVTQKPVAKDPKPLSASEEAQLSITVLESSITPRRIRESILGTDNGWLADVDSKIKALRKKLV